MARCPPNRLTRASPRIPCSTRSTSAGFAGDGRLLALNSYENRVYQVWLDDPKTRGTRSSPSSTGPGAGATRRSSRSTRSPRSSPQREIPVVAPLAAGGNARCTSSAASCSPSIRAARPAHAGAGGPATRSNGWDASSAASTRSALRAPSPSGPRSIIETFGARAARLAARAAASFRPDLLDALDERGATWRSLASAALLRARAAMCATLRLHGDCHASNVLWTDDGPHFVDFDDCRTRAGGPGPVDAALGRPRADDARSSATCSRGYARLPRLRSARAAPARGAAHPAPRSTTAALARAALGRSRIPRRVSLVQHPALLAGPDPGAEGADCADGQAPLQV